MTDYFKIKFYTPIACSYLRKLLNFIQLSVTMTKLCRIQHDLLVNFYVSLKT